MAVSNLVGFGFAACASAALTLAGCASPPGMMAEYNPGPVPGMTARNPNGPTLAETETPTSVWDQLKAWGDAMASRQSARPKLKNPGRLHLAYARWQEQLGNLVEARESYELALGDDPKSADAVLGLARLDQLNGRPQLAEQRYLKALHLKPNDANVLDATGQFYASQERWDRSTDLLQQAVLASPQESTHRYNLAVALARSGRIDEALPHFSRTVGEAEAHYNVGYILYEQGDLARAEREFLQAVMKRPDLGEAQQMLGEVRHHQAGRQMLAGRRQPNAQYPAQPVSQVNAGGTQPPGANYPSAGVDQNAAGRSANPYPDAIGQRPASADAAVPSSPDAYSMQRSFQHTPGPGPTWRDPAVAGGRPAVADSQAQQTLPPWHTSPEFERNADSIRYGTARTASPQDFSTNPPPTAPPVGAGPVGGFGANQTASDWRQPTPEQLEQWRNQFTPTNGGTGY